MKTCKAHTIGEVGEDSACRYLRRRGYSILGRNFKSKVGELDIIAAKNTTLIFIEVKTRTSEWMAKPFEFVDSNKQNKLRKLADGYLSYSGVDRLTDRFKNVRFDVLSVRMDDTGEVVGIEHILDAFE